MLSKVQYKYKEVTHTNAVIVEEVRFLVLFPCKHGIAGLRPVDFAMAQ